MKFGELIINNFGSIKSVIMPLDSQGLVLITGENRDAALAESNGSGKSLLLDAFTWCLWGETVRNFDQDGVVNEKVGKDCHVQVSFWEDGYQYEVRRYRKSSISRKPNDLELFCDGKDLSGVSITDTQKKINDILGLDFITFSAMMPGAGVNIAELTDSKIKELLERLLQTELLAKARERAKDKLKENKENISDLERTISSLKAWIVTNKNTLQRYKDESSSFRENKEKRISDVENKIEGLLNELDKYNKQIQAGKNIESALNEKLVKKAEIIKSIKEKRADVDKITSSSINKRTELKSVKNSLERNKKETVKQKQILKNLGSDCPTCLQTLDEQALEEVILNLDEKIEEYDSQIYLYDKELEELHEATEQDLIPLRKEIKELILKETAIDASISRFQEITQSAELAKTLKAKTKRYIEQLFEQQEEIQNEKNPFGDFTVDLESHLQEKEEQLAESKEKLGSYKAKQQILEFWDEGFSQSGIRSYVLDHITPALNSFADKHSKLLTRNDMQVTFHTKEKQKNGKIKEKFNIKVIQNQGGSSYRSSSSGERARANLIAALAIGDLAALRSSKKLPFKFLDEPFENVDGVGTETIVALLNEHKDTCDSIFVITHNDDFKQLFNNKWTIVKENGFSSWG